MRSNQNVAIIGAGPYGLSIAAHLAAVNIDFCIIGLPMQTWRQSMPSGMHLKSEPFASNLSGPEDGFTLSGHCLERGIAYRDTGLPVAVDTFVDYGLSFQQRYVPSVDEQQVLSIRSNAYGFEVVTDDGATREFRRVILATGITHYAHLADPFVGHPSDLVMHSANHRSVSGLAGRKVAVVGGGSSAVDCALAMVDLGAKVQLITRRAQIAFHSPPRPRSMTERLRWPMTPMGSGWPSLLYAYAPDVFRSLPIEVRHEILRKYLGPAACWFTREKLERNVHVVPNTIVRECRSSNEGIELILDNETVPTRIKVDHVIAATGYKVDIARLPFLDQRIVDNIRTTGSVPELSAAFESSVPGLHFVGPTAAFSFGPLTRFVHGASFTAKRLSHHLRKVGSISARPLFTDHLTKTQTFGHRLS